MGGWRLPAETPAAYPDSDLWERMATTVGAPRHIPVVTSVKLAARLRRRVYEDRPSHEQAYWLQYIRAAEDAGAALAEGATRPYPYAEKRPLLSRAARHLRRRLRPYGRLRDAGLMGPRREPPPVEAIEDQRRFKGAD